MFFKSIAEVMETSDAATKEANQSEEEPEIVTGEEKNKKNNGIKSIKEAC